VDEQRGQHRRKQCERRRQLAMQDADEEEATPEEGESAENGRVEAERRAPHEHERPESGVEETKSPETTERMKSNMRANERATGEAGTTTEGQDGDMTDEEVAAVMELREAKGPEPATGIPAVIANSKCLANLDTGATITIMAGRSYDELRRRAVEAGQDGLVPARLSSPGKLRLRAANGTLMTPRGLAYLPIRLGKRLALHRVVVADELDYDLVLGRDLLRAVGVLIDLHHGTARPIGGGEIQLVFPGERRSQERHGYRMDLAESTTLSPSPAPQRVRVRLQATSACFVGQEGMFHPTKTVQDKHGLAVAAGPMRIRQQRYALIEVLYDGDSERRLGKGTVMGMWYPQTHTQPLSIIDMAIQGIQGRGHTSEIPIKSWEWPEPEPEDVQPEETEESPTAASSADRTTAAGGPSVATEAPAPARSEAQRQADICASVREQLEQTDTPPAASRGERVDASLIPEGMAGRSPHSAAEEADLQHRATTQDGSASPEAEPTREQLRERVDMEYIAAKEAEARAAGEEPADAARWEERTAELMWEFRHVFGSKVGHTTLVRHHIDTGDSPPIRSKPYRLSQTEHQLVTQEGRKLLDQKLVRPSQSPWASPVVLIPKPDGTIRFCIDYRRINTLGKITATAFPMPRANDLLDTFHGAQFFTAVDITKSYYNVELDPASIPKSAFVTRDGLWEWLRMPMGLTTAGATLQTLMNALLAGMQWQYALCYLDDCIIYSTTFKDHLAHLREFFEKIDAAGVRLNLKKSFIAHREVTFLGHRVSPEGLRPTEEHIEAIQRFEEPAQSGELRRFLGLTGYYRRHVLGYASIAEPLTRLTREMPRKVWGQEATIAFEQLKQILTSAPVLAHPDWSKPFVLYTDASNIGLGAVLSQMNDDNMEVNIAYLSRLLTDTERKYSVSEKEMLAVVWSMRKLRHYLYGRKTKVVTDHKALSYVKELKDPHGRIGRWLLTLGEYDHEIVYRSGAIHINADTLSRVMWGMGVEERLRREPNEQGFERLSSVALEDAQDAYPNSEDLIFESEMLEGLGDVDLLRDEGALLKDMQTFQEEDTRCRAIRAYVSARDARPAGQAAPPLPDDPKLQAEIKGTHMEYYIEDGLLYHRAREAGRGRRPAMFEQVEVPMTLRKVVLYACHNGWGGGHQSANKTYEMLRARFHWPEMWSDAHYWALACPSCQRKGRKHGMTPGQLQSMLTTEPFYQLGIDLVGPLQKTKKGNVYLAVFTEYHTRWAEAFAIPDKSAPTIARLLLDEIMPRYGAPVQILTDQGKEFNNELLKSICHLMKTRKLMTAAYHPACNGLTERTNQTLIRLISMYDPERQDAWEDYLPAVLMAYRTSVQDSLGETPFYMLFGRDCRLPPQATIEAGKGQPPIPEGAFAEVRMERLADAQEKMAEAQERGTDNLRQRQARSEERHNAQNQCKQYVVGDLVLIRRPPLRKKGQKGSKKFELAWRAEPWTIERRIFRNTYKLRQNGKTLVSNVINMRHYHELWSDRERWREALQRCDPAAQAGKGGETSPDPNPEVTEGHDDDQPSEEETAEGHAEPIGKKRARDEEGGSPGSRRKKRRAEPAKPKPKPRRRGRRKRQQSSTAQQRDLCGRSSQPIAEQPQRGTRAQRAMSDRAAEYWATKKRKR
jgi:transposase InsO family protein